jgi:hypothetical protein
MWLKQLAQTQQHLRGVPEEPERVNARILERDTDNPFLTPPEAFVKRPLDLYQPTTSVTEGSPDH